MRVKPARQSGLITTFFSYTGRYDAAPGASRKHNEVDIEFVERRIGGQLRLVMQCNYFTEGLGGHEKFITLPFEPENEFHNYAFKWTKRYIKWFVDGKLVHTAFNNLPKLPHGPHKIMMNVWPVQPAAQNWAGTFNYQSVKTSTYAAVRFSRGENCKIENSFP